MPKSPATPDSAQPTAVPVTPPGLNSQAWNRAAGRLLAKTLGEFAYEEIIEPVPGEDGRYSLALDDADTLSFRARRGAYGSWRVDPDSIEYEGRRFSDPLAFLARARRLLALDGATLGHLLRELTTTLASDTRLDHTALTAAELAELGYAELEGHQTGHPWIVLNKGRIGFSATDTALWAPEARRPARLPWIAVSSTLAAYRGVPALAAPEDLYARELDAPVRESFTAALCARGLDPDTYLFLPVHPWQWDEVLLPLFAPAIAQGDIVLLPTDGDRRLPQQSIRTFANLDRTDRHTVKLPLSILNTLVWRGLPTERTLAAPAVTSWVHGLRDADPFLRDECGVILLGEVASVTVEHPLYDHLPEVPYQYKELLGAIWREPLHARLAPGERARTLASLLHTDPRGRSFTAELVERSGLAPTVWLQRLFSALLPPLLRFLYRYGTVFSPHGENAIVVYDEQDVPVRLAIKDFVDDVNVSARPLPEHDSMPEDVRRTLLTEEPAFLTQFIHSGLFVGVFRFLAPLCEEQLGVSEVRFFSLVRAEILRHQARFPELKERYEMFDLLTPRIERLCLNRNRLHLDGYRDRPHRPHAAVHGTVPNPLSAS
ncbi:IucA/IucC family siderophore biosynthesis protein [Streptomyces lunaelactis]|uniref:IucA/IucC family protein n=1 Tax=Streptomyces lunaelactis TaxID=1535768 RepID=UPI0015851BDD|nr:IucA/IucC family siderophore biosynthesis protein [Streptomyces lunaelactis]NUK01060.1 IucA/IucC family siderophore biosynthesis protein [Streptomyces lunaelactis]NUK08143.1 IucA/IucC family siderophore biosynthesis protein [Streptomyces lunaelactis]NUK15040.1 IucA/IucC family siderophore biosynthesis protein [Streptomyces lunaelactis]NUK33651.1 IucA/IucC family siderophore biosynthesis protein [Streptomyces lunaelactis]NUK91440.1 IucA/IucC family siderophore biosynthesis protein [Streptomy